MMPAGPHSARGKMSDDDYRRALRYDSCEHRPYKGAVEGTAILSTRPSAPSSCQLSSSLALAASLNRWPADAIFPQENLNRLPRNLDPLVPERVRPHQKGLITVVIQGRVVLHQPQVVD